MINWERGLNLLCPADSNSWIANARSVRSRKQALPLRLSSLRTSAFDPGSPRPYAYLSRMFIRWLRGKNAGDVFAQRAHQSEWLANTKDTTILVAITEDDIWSSASNDRLLYSRWLQGVTGSPHEPLPDLPWVHLFPPDDSADAASLLLLAQAMQWDWFAADESLDRSVGGDHDDRYFAYSNHADVDWLTQTLPLEPFYQKPPPAVGRA